MSLNLAQDAMDNYRDDCRADDWKTYQLYVALSGIDTSEIDMRGVPHHRWNRAADHNAAVKKLNDALDLIRGHYEGE